MVNATNHTQLIIVYLYQVFNFKLIILTFNTNIVILLHLLLYAVVFVKVLNFVKDIKTTSVGKIISANVHNIYWRVVTTINILYIDILLLFFDSYSPNCFQLYLFDEEVAYSTHKKLIQVYFLTQTH